MAHTIPDVFLELIAHPLCTRCGESLSTRPMGTLTGTYCSVGCAEADAAELAEIERTYLTHDDKAASRG